jgi:CopA family copper-resistance protein
MDGVPGVTFPGIKPGETFRYKYSVPQSGTYWYHSHSGLQEQQGHYGPIIIDPKDSDPIEYDREYVLVLSDWTFQNPHSIFAKLKSMGESFNYQKKTIPDFIREAKINGFGRTAGERAQWGAMRMSPTDISDVTGATYTYLINGRGTQDNWNGVFSPGERVRLRIINASAMTIFNVRIPGLPMTIVASDGLNVRPHEIDEFQMGVAETYDVIIEPKDNKAYGFVAESIDRSGQVVATFGPRPGLQAAIPALRQKPHLTMKDMGMDHGSMDMGGGDMPGMDHSKMDHGKMDMPAMDHGSMDMGEAKVIEANIRRGPGVINIAEMPISRLHEPGIGLESVPHRTLNYADLRSLDPNPDTRAHEREIVLHLTSNMERYMWSFDGVKFSHVKESIKFYQGERVRVTLINDTMMPHPIHLHGMFFDLVNGGGNHKPRKHTVIVKPGEKLSFDVSAEHVGDWAFHCHLLYHMHAGMMQVVSLLPAGKHEMKMDHSKMNHGDMKMEDKPAPMDHSQMPSSKMKGMGK